MLLHPLLLAAFATFTGIVIYHSVQQTKSTRLWRRLFQRPVYVRVPLTDVDAEPEDQPGWDIQGRQGKDG